MANNTMPSQFPQQPYYPSSPNQSPNHWKIAMIVLIIILISGIVIWSVKSQLQLTQIQNTQQKQSINTGLETATNTNQTIPPTPQSSTPQTVSLLYRYNNYYAKTKQLYQSDIYGKNKSVIKTEEEKGFTSSRNKKYLARWDDTQLEVASAKNIASFKKIAETSKPNTRLSQVIFSSDDTKIAFIIAENLEPEKDFGQIENNLHIINVDGTDQKLIKQFSEPYYLVLEGFNSFKNELYWFETGPGGFVSNFTIVNLIDGSIKEIKKDLDPGLDFSFNLTSDFNKAYYIKDNKTIIEYTLSNNNKRVLYELDNVGKDQYGNKSMIDKLRLSPNDNLLVFSRLTEPDDKEVILSLNLPSGTTDILLDIQQPFHTSDFSHFSPDGKYILFSKYCLDCNILYPEYFIIDITTKATHSFFKAKEKESLTFITWLNTD